MVFIALWFLLNLCGIFSSSSCDSCINVFIMDWAACWCAFCASLRPDCRIICFCLFLHVTMNLVTHCAPLLAAMRHSASFVQPQVTLNCVHSSEGDEAYNCTPLHGSECTDRHGLSYTRGQLRGRRGLPLHPTPWVGMYRPSWPVLHQRSALVLSGSASRSLPDLSPQRARHQRSFSP